MNWIIDLKKKLLRRAIISYICNIRRDNKMTLDPRNSIGHFRSVICYNKVILFN